MSTSSGPERDINVFQRDKRLSPSGLGSLELGQSSRKDWEGYVGDGSLDDGGGTFRFRDHRNTLGPESLKVETVLRRSGTSFLETRSIFFRGRDQSTSCPPRVKPFVSRSN